MMTEIIEILVVIKYILYCICMGIFILLGMKTAEKLKP